MTHSLTLGALTLTGDSSFPDPTHGFWFEVCAEGTEFGTPEAVTEVVRSLLSDGDIVRYSRDGNRTVPIRVRVHGPTLAAVAHGEAALRRETKRNNELTWQPPDTFAPPSVYETYPSPMTSAQESGWDLDELVRRVRTFSLNLACSPFARSLNAVVIEALAAGTTTVTVDTCDSATNWDGFRNGFPYAASTAWEAGSVAVAELEPAITAPETWAMTRNGSVDFTTTPYLVAEVRTISSDYAPPLNIAVTADGTTLPLLEVTRLPGSSYYRATFNAAAAGVVSALTFTHVSTAGDPWQGLFVREIRRTNVLPGYNPRQLTRIIEGRGTERTPGSIQVTSPASGTPLGQTIVHTCPEVGSGYSPSLRRWRVSGNTVVPELTRFSGAYEPTEPDAFIAQVPNDSLPPGDYLLMARLYSTAAGDVTVNWAAGTIVNSQPQGQEIGSTTINFSAAGWRTFPLAVLALPTVRSLGPVTQIDIQTSTSDSVTTQIDEGWVFRMGEDCGLTIVNNPTENLWLDSPNMSDGVPRVWIGDIEDRSDARHPAAGLVAFGSHIISPDGTALYTATEVDSATATAWYYPRWPFNAAE